MRPTPFCGMVSSQAISMSVEAPGASGSASRMAIMVACSWYAGGPEALSMEGSVRPPTATLRISTPPVTSISSFRVAPGLWMFW